MYGVIGIGAPVLATVYGVIGIGAPVLANVWVAKLRRPTALASTNNTKPTNINHLFMESPESQITTRRILCGLVLSRGKCLDYVSKQYTPSFPALTRTSIQLSRLR